MALKRFLQKTGLYAEKLDYSYSPDENHIETLNFWPSYVAKNLWMYQFAQHHFAPLLTAENSLLISSVFAAKKNIKLSKSRVKFFYSGENLERFPEYKDYCKGIADVAAGFDYFASQHYQRFPLWLTFFFPPFSDRRIISEFVHDFVEHGNDLPSQRKFAAMVCSHDRNGVRKTLFNALSEIERVDSGGSFLNNTTDLKEKFADNKRQFIKQYKFNICTENSDTAGYVTEKLFEAIKCNTVPVYWGSNNRPEPEILNHDAIIFYEKGKTEQLVKQVRELHLQPKLYNEFISQPRFQPNAAEYIEEMFNGLYAKLDAALKNL